MVSAFSSCGVWGSAEIVAVTEEEDLEAETEEEAVVSHIQARETEQAILEIRAQEEVDDEPPQGFIIAKTQQGCIRRLHFAGGCWRVPGKHYMDYIDCGQECHSHELIHARCTDCLPGDEIKKDVDEEASQEAEGADTSSSESEADPEADQEPGS